jgi:hypothetical protein
VAVNPVDPPIGGFPVTPRSSHPSRPPADRRPMDGSAVGDAVDGAVAVLAVTAALVRYAAEVAARTRRRVLPRLPFTGQGLGVRRALHGPVARVLAHPASAAVLALAAAADRLVPDMTRAVLARLDVPALVREFADLNRLAAPLDVDAVVARVDLDAIVDKVDIARIIDRVDLDAIVGRVDLDAIVDRVDLDRAVNRVDLDRAVDRVDVDRVIARTDVAGLARYVVQEIDLPGLLRASTGSVSSEMVRGVRDQGADADRAVERIVDRLLHRAARRTGTAAGGAETRPDGGT